MSPRHKPAPLPFADIWQWYLSQLDQRPDSLGKSARDFTDNRRVMNVLASLYDEGYDPGLIVVNLSTFFMLRFSWDSHARNAKIWKRKAARIRRARADFPSLVDTSGHHTLACAYESDSPPPKRAVSAAHEWLIRYLTSRGTRRPHDRACCILLNRAFRPWLAASGEMILDGITLTLPSIIKARQRFTKKPRRPRT